MMHLRVLLYYGYYQGRHRQHLVLCILGYLSGDVTVITVMSEMVIYKVSCGMCLVISLFFNGERHIQNLMQVYYCMCLIII